MTRPWTARAALLLVFALGGSPLRARADDLAPTLPFTPPAGFSQLPTALLPKDATSWTRGTEVFSINRMPDGPRLPFADLAKLIEHQTASLGTLTSATSSSVCGGPAMRATAVNREAALATTEQIESHGNATYILSYARPSASRPAPEIAHVLATFCGTSAGAPMAPPPGWKAADTHLLGIWLSANQETLAALQAAPERNAEARARSMMGVTVKVKRLRMLSERETKLCGLPAFTLHAKALPGSSFATDVTFEFTQSKTQAFFLVYTRPDAGTPSAAAAASLATLCAARAVAPAAPGTSGAPEGSPAGGTTPPPEPAPSAGMPTGTPPTDVASPTAPSASPGASDAPIAPTSPGVPSAGMPSGTPPTDVASPTAAPLLPGTSTAPAAQSALAPGR